MKNEKNLSQPQTGRGLNNDKAPDRHGDVPDGASQEKSQAKSKAKQAPMSRELNEGGRTNDSSKQGNPRGSDKGLPTNVGTPGADR